MAFCDKCGKQIPDGAAFCPGCGNRITPAAPGSDAAPQPPRVTPPVTYTTPAQPDNTGYTTPAQALPMNFYKFVIWVQMFLAALVSVGNGFQLLTGSVYAQGARWIYAFYPALQVVNILFGLIFLAVAAAAIYVRQELAHFKKNAPTLYYLYLIAVAAINFLYAVLTAIILSSLSTIGGGVVGLITNGVMVALCHIYFEKRSALFCN